MTKYIIYADDADQPGGQIVVKKVKHEADALGFADDVRNLSKYGCMTIIKADDDGRFVWRPDTASWERVGG